MNLSTGEFPKHEEFQYGENTVVFNEAEIPSYYGATKVDYVRPNLTHEERWERIKEFRETYAKILNEISSSQ